MRKVSSSRRGRGPEFRSMSLSPAMVVVFIATIVVSGCGSEADRRSAETTTPAEAGLLSAPGTDTPAQDSTPMVIRRVWGGHGVNLWGDISPDGRHLVFIDGDGGVAVRELATGETRSLTPDANWFGSWQVAEGASISPDGRQVAYSWYLDSDPEYELRVVDWEGGEPRVILQDRSLSWYGAGVWSPDGRQILIHAVKPDNNGELSLVSVADGSRRTVKELGPVWPVGFDFSPDGRYTVYDLPEGENSNERDIYIISVSTGQVSRVVQDPANDFVLGWAPNGKYILFASDRAGSLGAWLLPVADGKAAGEARLIKADLWRIHGIGFTDDGYYCYGIPLTHQDVYVATLDPESGAVISPPAAIDGEDLGSYFRPHWSPDGRYLSYTFQGASVSAWYTDRYYLGIRSVETGETRNLALGDVRVFGDSQWFPDGHHLLVGHFKVDVQTGEAEPMESLRGLHITTFLGFSPDGRDLFYRKRLTDGTLTANGRATARMDLERGMETILSTEPADQAALSPDARYLAFALIDETGFQIGTKPADGGALRELMKMEPDQAPDGLWGMAWSPDGRYLYYMTLYANEPHQLWRLSTDGGSPQKILELDPTLNIPTGLSFHPDGRRITFEGRKSSAEVWLMEDFMPPDGDGGP